MLGKSFIVLAAVTVAGCATITKGTTQVISVNTIGTTGATCVISSSSVGTRTVVTPATVSLDKGAESLTVRCTKDCFEDGVGVIASNTEGMTAGNVILGGVIGLGIDAASGAMHKYNSETTIAMQAKPNCRPART